MWLVCVTVDNAFGELHLETSLLCYHLYFLTTLTHTIGLLWSKQFYHYIIEAWLNGDPQHPDPPRERLFGRNASGDWAHLFNRDVISMPDKWEYPWVCELVTS